MPRGPLKIALRLHGVRLSCVRCGARKAIPCEAPPRYLFPSPTEEGCSAGAFVFDEQALMLAAQDWVLGHMDAKKDRGPISVEMGISMDGGPVEWSRCGVFRFEADVICYHMVEEFVAMG